MNGDGDPDIVVQQTAFFGGYGTNSGTSELIIIPHRRGLAFGGAADQTTSFTPRRVQAVDFAGTRRSDLLVQGDSGAFLMRTAVLKSTAISSVSIRWTLRMCLSQSR